MPRFKQPMRSAISRYGDRIGSAVDGGVDPHWASVVLYAPLQGVDTSTALYDLSGRHTVSANGTGTLVTAQKPFGISSYLSPSVVGEPHISMSDSADWNFGSGDWTIEMAVRWTTLPSSSTQGLFSQWSTSSTPAQNVQASLIESAGTYTARFSYNNGGGAVNLDTVISPSTVTWYYFGWSRSGTTLSFSNNGSVSTAAISGTLQDSASGLLFGATQGASAAAQEWFVGHIGYIRVTKGVARDMATIPTTLFPITAG